VNATGTASTDSAPSAPARTRVNHDVSKVIVRSALARENSRGAHFRADFPDAGELDTSSYTRVRQSADGTLDVQSVPVQFTRVRPGTSLV